MYIEQIYTNCLAEAAYFIESDGEAAVIDPLRDTDVYLKKATEKNARIKYIFETHFHADFISGHLDLASKTGAEIVYGPGAETKYKATNANDQQEFKIGKIRIKVLHTPGHTPESACFLLINEEGKEYAVFTGDTLFVGDVGRPDLLDGKMTKEELASMMYDSLNNKILPLNDDVIVYPAHGPGSACGKNIGKETWSTIGEQKKSNYALQKQSREDFIRKVTDGLTAPPLYFFSDARINKEGYDLLDSVMTNNLKPLSPAEFKSVIEPGTVILDTRSPEAFESGYVPNSVNIGLNGTFAVWVGSVIDINSPLLIVCDEGKEQETVLRLARVGYENVKGYLKGGINAWQAAGYAIDKVESINPEEFKSYMQDYKILDVRKPGEFEGGFIKGAVNIPLGKMEDIQLKLNKEQKILVHCAGGYRSMIAVSLLKNAGYKNLVNVRGGYGKIKEQGIDVEVPQKISI